MKKTANLNLCIIGGRSFGKTSLAVSLLNIADKTDESITPIGSSTKILALKNDFLSSGGQLQSTGWQEIKQFTFKLVGKGQRAWRLHFYDYPGELFEKYIDEAAETQWRRFWTAIKSSIGIRKQNDDTARIFDAQAGLKAFDLMRRLEKSDALIILVPADITDEKYHRDLATYRAKLKELIDKIQDHSPKIPICLAVNKWDMFGKGIDELDGVLQIEPFQTFFNILASRCPENFFPMAISAFGKHKNDKEGKPTLADRTGVPTNVLEMLFNIAEKAEKVRQESFVEKVKSASFLRKVFIVPFQSWLMNRKGCSDASERETLLKIARQAWWQFWGATAAILAIISGITLGAWTSYEYMGLGRLKSEIAKSKLEYIQKNDILAWTNKASQQSLPRILFLNDMMTAIRGDINKVESAYNDRIIGELNRWIGDLNNRDVIVDMEKKRPIAPEERKRRSTERIKKINEALPALTLPEKKADLEKMVADENELQKNIEIGTPLDNELISVYVASEEERCRKAEEVIQKIAKGELTRDEGKLKALQDDLKAWEGSLQTDLEKALAQAPDNVQGVDWKKRKADAEFRIKAIQGWEAKFAKSSEWLKQHQAKIAEERKLIVSLEWYGPFDDALRGLNRQHIRDIAAFLNKYNLKDYPERAARIEKLEEGQKKLLAEEQRKLDAVIAENNHTDVALSAQTRIDRAKRRIDAHRAAMLVFVENSGEYSACQAEMENLEGWIRGHEKYIAFDDAWSKVSQKSEDDRIPSIDAFLSAYSAEDYPEYQERIAEVEKQRAALKEALWKKLNEELGQHAKEHAQGSWKTLVARANERIQIVEAYRARLGADSKRELDTKADVEKRTIASLTRDGKFNDAFDAACKSPDSILLIKIAAFRADFKAKDYSDKNEAFQKLEKLEKDCEGRLSQELKNKRAALVAPEGDEKFAEWSQFNAKRIELLDEFISQYPDGSPQKIRLTTEKGKYESERKKQNDWAKIKVKTAEIEMQSDKAAPDTLLAAVGVFMKDFSEDFGTTPEVSPIFERIKAIQQQAENAISQEIEEQLRQYSDAATREDRIASYENQLRVIEDNLHRFVSGSDLYKRYQAKATQLSSRMDAAQKTKRIEAAHAYLIQKMTDTNRADQKIQLIDSFTGLFPESEYPEKKTWFSELSAQKTRLTREMEWADFADKITALNTAVGFYANRNSLSSTDYTALKIHRETCTKYIKDTEKYKTDFKDPANTKIQELEQSVKLIEKLIGDGSFKSIEDLEKKYKANPNDETYKALKNAIDGFDSNLSENSKNADSVETIKTNLNKNRSLAEAMRSAFRDFKSNPSQDSFFNFKNAVWEYNQWVTGENEHGQKVVTNGYESKDDALGRYVNFIKSVSAAINFKASWNSFDFYDTNFHSLTDNDVELFVNGETKVRIRDINVNTWNRSSNRYKTQKGNCDFSVTLPFGTPVDVKLINYTGVDTEGTDNVLFWEIIAKGTDKGEYDCVLRIRGNGGKTKKATVTLRFSKLPRLAE